MAKHAKLGPSAAERWMNCTASVALIDDLAERGVVDPGASSVYADEGTAAHEVRERCLNDPMLEPHDLIGEVITVNGAGYEVTEEMADALLPGIDLIREYTSTPDIEIRVDLSPWLPGQFGTLDAGWIVEEKAEPVFNMDTGEWETRIKRTLYISDLKYGMGENVEAKNNKQQMLYALGYWHFKGRPQITKIVIIIDQPRLGGLKDWETTLEHILAFGELATAAYEKIYSEDVVFHPSEKGCRWCLAKEAVVEKGYTGCAAYHGWMTSIFSDAFDKLDEEPEFEDPEELTPERRYYIVRHAKLAEKWLAALHEASLKAALLGTPDPGSKAVIGQRGDRKYTDELAAELLLWAALEDKAYQPRKIIGIPDAEKALKPGRKRKGDAFAWAELSELIVQPDGKPILVPEDDERPAIKTYTEMFDDLD